MGGVGEGGGEFGEGPRGGDDDPVCAGGGAGQNETKADAGEAEVVVAFRWCVCGQYN